MRPASFLRTPEVQRALKLAHNSLGAPISIHFVDGDLEGKALAGCGGCQACAYVVELSGGEDKCRASRLSAAPYAITRDVPAGFVCHMGFPCVSVPLLPQVTRGLVLTLGPFCPAEAASTLARDAMNGLRALGVTATRVFPTPLSDIPIVDPDAPAAVAEWLADTIALLWRTAQLESLNSETESEPTEVLREPRREVDSMEMSSFPFDGTSSGTSSSPFEGKPSGRSTPQTSQTTRGRPRRLRSKLPDNSPYRGAEIVAAVAAGDITQAGRLIRSALANAPVDSRRNGRVRAARAIALASAVLEAAESAGLDIEDVWKQFPEFVALVYTRSNENELVAATRALFRRAARRSDDPDLAAIDRYVLDALPRQSAIRLDELAAALGKHPTAITHRLQRKFGLSFKQYVSRLRIDRAKDLLCRTRLSVTDVAMRVGVDDPANFAKLFRKFEGLSPLQYRERYGVRP